MRTWRSIDSIDPRWQLFRLMDGFVVTQLLYVASELGVAQALADGPRTGAELAEAVDADAGALTRVLRGLALEDVVDERDGRFALTPIGERWCRWPARCASAAQVYYGAAAGPARRRPRRRDGVRAHVRRAVLRPPRRPPRARRPRSRPRWRAAPSRRRATSSRPTTSARLASLVDVGGGRGVLLAAILDAAPHIDATLVDRAGRGRGRARAPRRARVRRGRLLRRRFRRARTPTCSRASCTTGTTRTRCASSPSAVPRCTPHAPAAGRRRDPARAREGRRVRDPHGPPHAAAARRARAHRGRVPRAAGRGRVRGRARRPDRLARGLERDRGRVRAP